MTAPFGAGHQVPVQPVGTAGNDLNSIVYVAPRAATVTSVTYTPLSSQTGSSTARTYNLVNLGQSGGGSTVVATLALTSGVNTTGGVPKTITLSGTAANLVLAANDVLQWQSVHVSTGITDPGGMVSIATAANYA